MLYLDSQMENFKLFTQSVEMSDNEIEDEENQIISYDQTSKFESPLSEIIRPVSCPNMISNRNINDLITDDERDGN